VDPVALTDIARWADGELLQGDPHRVVTNICTDSRKLAAGDLFLALRGDKFDAHHFIEQAAKLGAAGVVAEEAPDNLPADFAVIRVANTLDGLQQIAAKYRASLPLKVVAITGSNGKTSTKDFTAAVLRQRFHVVKTDGNLNNHIGLPLTMLSAKSSDEIGVFEIGMNHPGEVAPLAKLARPDVGVITNIGVAHIEFMKTREAIAQEKGMLAEAVGVDGHVVLAAVDDYAAAIAKRTKARVVLAGVDSGDVRASDVRNDESGSLFTLHANGKNAAARLGVPGQHMIRNALLAVAVGVIFGVSLEDCAAALERVRLTKGRLEQKLIRGIRVLDDSYNANPDSMLAALRTLAEMPGQRIAVLGQMNELGVESERSHREVGEAAAREKIDCVITVGPIAAGIAQAASEHGVKLTLRSEDTAAAAEWLRKIAKAGDTVLIKGSRSVRMETIVEELARA
jgi:UDP-N-acetylmuramoyl-tripeptide--D-alanyl-D-alanine ligase